jgi:hypothetical protein
MNNAQVLKAAIERSGQGHRPEPIADPFAEAIARRLQARGIANVPGLPVDEPALDGLDILTEQRRRGEAFAAQREAQHQADEVAEMSAADMIRSLLADDHARRVPQIAEGTPVRARTTSSADPLPLNGDRLQRAAEARLR